jgi:hypothetical protein
VETGTEGGRETGREGGDRHIEVRQEERGGRLEGQAGWGDKHREGETGRSRGDSDNWCELTLKTT